MMTLFPGGNRRYQPATKAELQAGFEADCNAQNYNSSDDSESVSNGSNDFGVPVIDRSNSKAVYKEE